MSKFIMAIDQGTTGSTVSLYDFHGEKVDSADQDFQQIFPQPGWVEHNPGDIWQSILGPMSQLRARHDLKQVACIGITNQRETVLVWDRKNGEPVHNALVWQDRRTADFLRKLKKNGVEKKVQSKTGLLLDPYFSASKIRWILDADKNSRKRDLAVGTMDSYVLWKLSREHKTDVSNASRTMLMNLQTLQWDAELCRLFAVPENFLPQIRPSGGLFGKTHGVPGLPDGIPITGMIGDQQSALFGQGAWSAGQTKCTFGTGSFILQNTGAKPVRSRSRLLTTVAWQFAGEEPIYALEGGAFVCGAAVQWLRDGLKIIKTSSEVEALAEQVPDSGGVVFVPALTGLGAPHWNAEARGVIWGLTRGSTSAHIARATLEAMALQNVEIFRAMEKDSAKKMKQLKVDGGACANNLLMQLQADFLGAPIERPQDLESTSRGAMLMAGLGSSLFQKKDLQRLLRIDRVFQPQLSAKNRSTKLTQWSSIVKKA